MKEADELASREEERMFQYVCGPGRDAVGMKRGGRERESKSVYPHKQCHYTAELTFYPNSQPKCHTDCDRMLTHTIEPTKKILKTKTLHTKTQA